MHHLLISEEPELRLSDLLSIESTSAASTSNGRCDPDIDRQIPKSPLTDIIQYPVYIPQLYSRIQIAVTNTWNEFKSKYDPFIGKSNRNTSTASAPTTSAEFATLHDPKPIRNDNLTLAIETLPQLFASLLISYVNIANDFYKGFYATRHHPMIKMKFLNSLINREVQRRNISWDVIWHAMYTTLNPIRITKVFAKYFGSLHSVSLCLCFRHRSSGSAGPV